MKFCGIMNLLQVKRLSLGICFQPNEESVLAVSSQDNRLSIWDFSVENDNNEDNLEVPDQLMFLH